MSENKEKLVKLVTEAQQGSQDAFDELFAIYKNKFYQSCLYHLSNTDLAEDICQEVMIKVYRKLDTLNEPEKFVGWVNKIIENRCIDYYRSADRNRNVNFSSLDNTEEDLEFDPADDKIENQPEMKYSDTARSEIVNGILGNLSEEQRQVTVLHFYDHLTLEEIAEQLGISLSTVVGRYNTAKKNIKNEVIALQKRDDLKLYNLSPIPFFLWMLGSAEEGFVGGSIVSEAVASGVAAEVASIAASTGTAAAGATAAAGTTAVASVAAGTSAAVKIAISAAIAAGIGVAGVAGYQKVNASKQAQKDQAAAEKLAEDQKKAHKEAYRFLNATFKLDDQGKELQTFEYGSDQIELKNLIQTDSDLLIEPYEILKADQVGSNIVTYTISSTDKYGEKVSKSFVKEYQIVDTEKPKIKLSKKTVTLDQDDSFDAKSYIESIKDPVDGKLKYLEKEPEKSKTAPYYKEGFYLIESNVNTKVPGTYEVKITAADKNGNRTEKKIAVTVQGKTETGETSNNQSTASDSSSNQTTAGNTESQQTVQQDTVEYRWSHNGPISLGVNTGFCCDYWIFVMDQTSGTIASSYSYSDAKSAYMDGCNTAKSMLPDDEHHYIVETSEKIVNGQSVGFGYYISPLMDGHVD